MRTIFALILATFNLVNSSTLSAENHVINAVGVSFSPEVLTIEPGDSVQWNTLTVHSVGAVDGFIPDGAVIWESEIGENVEMSFTQEGIYIYRCKPHQRLAMAGAVIVGNPTNLDDLKTKIPEPFLVKIVEKAIAAAEQLKSAQ